MAPSPTGEYHIGHIRTLLYNWAFAKKYNGDFILRIEDTDRERFVAGATDRILEVIKSYGLVWDEGPQVGGPHEPYFQSQRLEIYQKHAQILLDKGAAYYCFCTEERLEKMREEQKARHVVSTKYDRLCLKLDKSEVTWLKLESSSSGFAMLRGRNSDIIINGVKITSWDSTKNDYDRELKDGRIMSNAAEHHMRHLSELRIDGSVKRGMVIAVDRAPPRRHAIDQFAAVLQGEAHAMGAGHRIDRQRFLH